MSDANVALAKRWFEEVWNRKRTEVIDELLTDESVGHLESGDCCGSADFKDRVHAQMLALLPDLKVVVEDTVAQGDHVVVRWSASGTHTGEALGFAPTHRKVAFRGMTWIRYQGGKMAEGWDCWNQDGLFRQLSGQ
jgi:steroid delta-isomerase-like uncharacterized protein